MAEIVINIDDNWYEQLQNNIAMARKFYTSENYEKLILEGTPLPKGHRRIGDLDKLIQTMKELNDDNGGEPLNAVDRGYDLAYQHMVEVAKECVIIKTDKEEENESDS